MDKKFAKSPKISKVSLAHIRSNSFPTTSSSLINSNVTEALLPKLITILKAGSSSSSSSSSICQKLLDIKDLYQGIENSIQCPLVQQALSLELHRGGGVEEVLLDGSMKLLDFCGSTNDVLSSMKESILELQSCIRRKNGGQDKNINAYLMSRKKIQKIASRHLKTLQATLNTKKEESCEIHIVRMLQDVETLILSTLECLLAYIISRPKGNNVWSLSKFTTSKSSSCKKQDVNEIEKIDNMICGLEAKKANIDAIMSNDLLKQLGSLELVICDIEGCLESISRCLIRTRVSLLNILSQ